MATIAKGMITLSVLNDAYTVSLSPNSCVIHADFDGSNPHLDTAFTNISVVKGDVPTKFELKLTGISNANIVWHSESLSDGYVQCIKIDELPLNLISGYLEFKVTTVENFSTTITFQFIVEKESTMLDWIKDWETNKTKIGSTYLITPKIFVGKRVSISGDERASGQADEGTLTGVYIGPDEQDGLNAGIYGLKQGDEIFHLNKDGGMMGGWLIETGGIQTLDGKLQILSNGNLQYLDDLGEPYWRFSNDGSGVLAHGNITWQTNGSAIFNGSITSTSGKIGNWVIGGHSLYNSNILLDSEAKLLGVCYKQISDVDQGSSISQELSSSEFFEAVKSYGGVLLHYTSSNSFGLEGWSGNNTQIFTLGSSNKIAGWTLDADALYLGIKCNQHRQYAQGSCITLGSNGLRGAGWYIDCDGTTDFMNGLFHFGTDGANIVGWSLYSNRLSTEHIALTSDNTTCGLYFSVANISDISSQLLCDTISNSGGLYIHSDSENCQIAAFNKDAKRTLLINSHGENYIGGWNFDHEAIWKAGTDTEGKVFEGFTEEGGINISPIYGIRGHQWRLEADGSGAIAGNKIKWGSDGNISFDESVSVQWGKGIDLAQRIAYGRMLYRDPENEKDQYNDAVLYRAYSLDVSTNEVHTNVERTIVSDSEAPTASQDHVIRYRGIKWLPEYYIGGFGFNTPSRKNAQFYVRIIAKIPRGFIIENEHYDLENDITTEWLTVQVGTDKYEEYRCLVTCGDQVKYSTLNHFVLKYANIGSPGSTLASIQIDWYVAYATVIDISASDKLTTYIDNHGIYTGTLNADQINAGTISAEHINVDEVLSNGDAWALKSNGSGYLANGNIQWNEDGSDVKITGVINAKSGVFEGAIKTGIKDINDSDAQALDDSGTEHLLVSDMNIVDHGYGHTIVLPTTDMSLVGTRVLIFNDVQMASRTDQTTRLRTQNSFKILGFTQIPGSLNEGDEYGYSYIHFVTGIIELLAVNINNTVRWVIIGNNVAFIEGSNNA